jgi:hypothetical protein
MMCVRAAPVANDNVQGAVIRFAVEPRLVTPQKAARRLHLSLTEFENRLLDLLKSGFPAPCDITGNFDLKAIDLWLDRRSGLDFTERKSPAGHARNASDVVWGRLANG